MIKFFRKKREKTLKENKFGKYLIYAIGEIVLVVIGILIALQINNWNERRKNNVIELDFVKNLIIDLNSDIVEINMTIEFNKIKIANLDSVLMFVGKNINELPDQDELIMYNYRSISSRYNFENQNRTLNRFSDLENGIIRQNVSDSIANFQQELLTVKSQSLAYTEALVDLQPIVFKLFSFSIMHDSLYFDQETYDRTGEHFPKINDDMELQKEYFNYITWAHGVTSNYVSEIHLQGHLERTKALIQFLEAEYGIE